MRGVYSTLSFGECPSVESASLLSAILEASPHPKYSLSAKACLGILRRAERRGKPLPDRLRRALERKAALYPSTIKQPDATGGGQPGTMTELETALELEQTGTRAQPSPQETGMPCFLPVENHPQDCRVKLSNDGIFQTLSSKMGTGGQCPSDFTMSACLRMRAGCAGGGKGALIQIEKSGTLCPNNDQILFTMQGFGDYITGGWRLP